MRTVLAFDSKDAELQQYNPNGKTDGQRICLQGKASSWIQTTLMLEEYLVSSVPHR